MRRLFISDNLTISLYFTHLLLSNFSFLLSFFFCTTYASQHKHVSICIFMGRGMMRSLLLVGAKTCLGWLFKERYKVIEVSKPGGYLD